MALRRPRRAAAGVGAVRRAADADRRRPARASKKSGCRATTTCRCAACRSRSKPARRRAIFVLNTAPVYGRIELEVSLAEGADFELFGANIGTGLSTNEIVTTVKHIGVGGRSRQTIRSVLNGKAVGSYLGKVEVARGAQQTDAEQSVKAMLLDRGATANCKPELEIFADDVKCAHGATRRRARRDAIVLRRKPRARPGERAGAAARRLRHGPVGQREDADAIRDAARDALRRVVHERPDPHQFLARRPRPVPGDRRLALSRQRRDRAKAAGGDRCDHPGLCARLCDRASRRLRALGDDDREL